MKNPPETGRIFQDGAAFAAPPKNAWGFIPKITKNLKLLDFPLQELYSSISLAEAGAD